jgi:hypothetical protein
LGRDPGRSAREWEEASLNRLRKNSGSHRSWEGHEFHSCRNCHSINSGFRPLGNAAPKNYLFRKPLGYAQFVPD